MREKVSERKREKESVCKCVCVCVYEKSKEMEDFIYIDKNVYVNILLLFINNIKNYILSIGIVKVCFCVCTLVLIIFYAKKKNKKKKINVYLELVKRKRKNRITINANQSSISSNFSSFKNVENIENTNVDELKNEFYYLTLSSHILDLKTINRVELCNVCEENIYSFIFHKKYIFECVICKNKCHVECAQNSNLMSCKTCVFFKNKHKFIKLRNCPWNNHCEICKKKFFFLSFFSIVHNYVYKCIWCNKYFHLKCLKKGLSRKKTKDGKSKKRIINSSTDICTYGNNKFILYPYQINIKEDVLLDYLVSVYGKAHVQDIKKEDFILKYILYGKDPFNKTQAKTNTMNSNNINNAKVFSKNTIVSDELLCFDNIYQFKNFRNTKNEKKNTISVSLPFLLNFFPIHMPIYEIHSNKKFLLIFVNVKSGGQIGKNLYRELLMYFNPIQIINIKNEKNVLNALNMFKEMFYMKKIILLICGGDGTISIFVDTLISFFLSENISMNKKSSKTLENKEKTKKREKGTTAEIEMVEIKNKSELNALKENERKNRRRKDIFESTYKSMDSFIKHEDNKKKNHSNNNSREEKDDHPNESINDYTKEINGGIYEEEGSISQSKKQSQGLKEKCTINDIKSSKLLPNYTKLTKEDEEPIIEMNGQTNNSNMDECKVEPTTICGQKNESHFGWEHMNNVDKHMEKKESVTKNEKVHLVLKDTPRNNLLNNLNMSHYDIQITGPIKDNTMNKKQINKSSSSKDYNSIKKDLQILEREKKDQNESTENSVYSNISTIPICIMPLGTGNDLSISLGWGNEYNNDLFQYLNKIKDANSKLIDIWNIKGYDADNNLILKNNFINYFDIGIIARLALHFDNIRKNFPHFFNSRIGNKILYGEVGFRDFCFNTYKYKLNKNIKIYCDGKKVRIQEDLESVCIINIPYFLGGIKIWKEEEQEKNYYSDSENEKKKKKQDLFSKDDSSSSDSSIIYDEETSNDINRKFSNRSLMGCSSRMSVETDRSNNYNDENSFYQSRNKYNEIYNSMNVTKMRKIKTKVDQTIHKRGRGDIYSDDTFCSEFKKDFRNQSEKMSDTSRGKNYPYEGGNIYRSYRLDYYKHKNGVQKYRKQRINDKLIEVIGFRNIFHLFQVQIGMANAIKLCQGNKITVKMNKKFIQNKNKIYFQYDGEPGFLSIYKLHFTHKCQSLFLSPKGSK